MVSFVYITTVILTILLTFVIIRISVKKSSKDKYQSPPSDKAVMAVQSYLDTLHGPIDVLQEQCLRLYNKGSFWLAASSNGNSIVENVVSQIFAYHVPNDFRYSDKAGAEFWVQVREQTKHDSLPFHFDKDEALFSAKGLMRNPDIATVTYLSQGAAPPTVIFALTPEDVDIETDKCFRTPKNAFVCFPKRGKHLAFRGNMYHGVLGRMQSQKSSEPRVTLLVNIWLTDRPANTRILTEEYGTSLSVIQFDPSSKETPIHVDEADDEINFYRPTRDIPFYILENPSISSCVINY